jgi:hypothetical protein
MSHSFFVATSGDVSYDHVVGELDTPDVVATDEVELPGDGSWPAGTIYLYIDNLSARPLEVTYENGNMQVRIFQGSSYDDYRFALNLTKAFARHYGDRIRPEDNEAMDVEAFEEHYDEKWASDHCRTMVDMMIDMQKGESIMKMMGARAELQVGPRFMAQLLEDREHLYDNFFERFRRLNYIDREDVFAASKLLIRNEEGTSRLSIVAFGEDVPTLLPADADVVAMRREKGDMIQVPFDRFAEMTRDRNIWLSENALFVPACTGEEWSKLYSEAQQYDLEDVFVLGTEITAEERERYAEEAALPPLGMCSEDDLQKMTYAPFIVFVLISAADGEIDQEELDAFVGALVERQEGLLGELLLHVPASPQDMMKEIVGDPDSALVRLKEIGELIDAKLLPQHAISLKLDLWAIGKSVAEASGERLGLAGQVSDEEKAALSALAVILGLHNL